MIDDKLRNQLETAITTAQEQIKFIEGQIAAFRATLTEADRLQADEERGADDGNPDSEPASE